MAEYDLTQTILPYIDRHLSFPLLAHLLETALFPEEQVRLAQYELGKRTNMVNFTLEIFEGLYPNEEHPPEFAERRENAVKTDEHLQSEAQVVLDVIEREEVAQALRQDKLQNLNYLKEHYGLTLEQISVLYTFGQFQFSCGNYSGAADYLYHFRVLSTDHELNLSAHWGKLASDILMGQWDKSLEELNSLRETIDSRLSSLPAPVISPTTATGPNPGADSSTTTTPDPGTSAALVQLQARTWLLHWSLFVYFNHPQGRTLLLETFLSPAYLNTIQTSCPWILRYLCAAAILTRKQAISSGASTTTGPSAIRVKHALKEVVRIVPMEEYQYKDPVTMFLKELYGEFDFEEAQRWLGIAMKVVENDFFLFEFRQEFLDNARYLICEAYCRIHQKIDIEDLSARLNLTKDEGEKWIVNLIRDTRMGSDAKIDLEKNIIHINRPPPPLYQSVIEKTRGLAFRTQALGAAMSHRAMDEGQEGDESGTAASKGGNKGPKGRRPLGLPPSLHSVGTGSGTPAIDEPISAIESTVDVRA